MHELIPCSDLLRKLDVLPATFQLWQNAGLVPRVRRRNAKRYYTEEEAFLITVISELSKGRLLKVGTRGLDECCRSFLKDIEGKNRFAVCKIVYHNKSLIDAEWVLSDSATIPPKQHIVEACGDSALNVTISFDLKAAYDLMTAKLFNGAGEGLYGQ